MTAVDLGQVPNAVYCNRVMHRPGALAYRALMDLCPTCHGSIFAGRVDATFRLADETLADVFDVPGWICVTCDELYLAPRWIDLLGLEGARCLVAIATEAGLVATRSGRE